MKHLTQIQTHALHDQLIARENQLAAEIAAALAQRQRQQDEGRDVDTGSVDLEAALGLAELLRDEQELEAVRAALARIDRGTYGRCLSCGAGIPIERVRVQPEAALCHVCQTRNEGEHMQRFSAP